MFEIKTLTVYFLISACSAELQCNTENALLSCQSNEENNILSQENVASDEGVVEISLQYARLVDIDIYTFTGVPNLEILDLSSNLLTTLQQGVCDPLVNVHTLNVSRNSITDLPVNIFNSMKTLAYLDLSNNGLLHLPNDLFISNLKLTLLDLSSNKLSSLTDQTLSSLAFLKSLNLANNLLEDVSFASVLNTLTKLDVSGNKINAVPTLGPSLTYIDISNNQFTHFGTMIGMQIPKKLKTFRLHNNPWQCACLEQLLAVLKRRKIAFEFTLFFQGKAPLCVIYKNKMARCFRDSLKDQELSSTYANAMKNYPQ